MSTVDATLENALEIDGAIAAAGDTDVVRAELRVISRLGSGETIEDTLGTRFHLIRLLQSASGQGLFLHVVLDRARANLAMARRRLTVLERAIDV